MHPDFTEEQVELKASVERFCREKISPERLAAWEKEPAGIDGATWRAVADLGWFGLGIATEKGGSGLGLVEVACLVEECARGLIPLRVIEAIRGATVLHDLDPAADELAQLATGVRRATLALDERQARAPAHQKTIHSGDTVTGEKWCVLDPSADWHIVSARDASSGAVLLLVDGSCATHSALRSFDGSEQASVRYDRAPVHRRLASGDTAVSGLRRIHRVQTAIALAEMVGGMRACIDATIAYVKEREQFGQKIGVFQAVQHQIADMATALTAARHLTWRAISRLAYGTEEDVELELAAVFVARSFKDITMTSHHLHGGAGYVIEHPLHYHSERAQTLAIRYAPEGEMLDAVASSLLD